MKETMTSGAQMRRLQDTLIVAGAGVVAFSLWSMVKTAMFLALTDDAQLLELLGLDIPTVNILYITAGVIVVIDLAIRTYVGLSARAEGRGKRKSPVYLIVAAICAVLNAYSAIAIVLGSSVTVSVLDAVISIAIEATSLLALILVIYCSVRLRALRKASG